MNLNKIIMCMASVIFYHYNQTSAPHDVLTLLCQGPSFNLKCLVKMGHNSKIVAFRVMFTCLAVAPFHDKHIFKV